jgi:hypothetical protein
MGPDLPCRPLTCAMRQLTEAYVCVYEQLEPFQSGPPRTRRFLTNAPQLKSRSTLLGTPCVATAVRRSRCTWRYGKKASLTNRHQRSGTIVASAPALVCGCCCPNIKVVTSHGYYIKVQIAAFGPTVTEILGWCVVTQWTQVIRGTGNAWGCVYVMRCTAPASCFVVADFILGGGGPTSRPFRPTAWRQHLWPPRSHCLRRSGPLRIISASCFQGRALPRLRRAMAERSTQVYEVVYWRL